MKLWTLKQNLTSLETGWPLGVSGRRGLACYWRNCPPPYHTTSRLDIFIKRWMIFFYPLTKYVHIDIQQTTTMAKLILSYVELIINMAGLSVVWLVDMQPISLYTTKSLGALRAPTSRWRPFGPKTSGPLKVTITSFSTSVAIRHVSMMNVSMSHVSMMHISMMHVSRVHISMMHISMMHIFMMHVSMKCVSMLHVSMMHLSNIHDACIKESWTRIHVSMMHVSTTHVCTMYVSMTHISMLFDPRSWCMCVWCMFLWWTYEYMVHISMILDPWPWCMYVWCIVSVILDAYVFDAHIWLMHISMIFDPWPWCTYIYDAHMCDAHIYDSDPSSWCMHVSMMRQIAMRCNGWTDV